MKIRKNKHIGRVYCSLVVIYDASIRDHIWQNLTCLFRCMYGWLSDGHMGYVMQKSGARETCSKGKHGLIYTSEKDPLTTAPGVYCLKTNGVFYSLALCDPVDIVKLKFSYLLGQTVSLVNLHPHITKIV